MGEQAPRDVSEFGKPVEFIYFSPWRLQYLTNWKLDPIDVRDMWIFRYSKLDDVDNAEIYALTVDRNPKKPEVILSISHPKGTGNFRLDRVRSFTTGSVNAGSPTESDTIRFLGYGGKFIEISNNGNFNGDCEFAFTPEDKI